MRKTTKILAFLVVIATVISLLTSIISAEFAEKGADYDDYGYYIYYDFEEYGSSSNHSAYFKNAASVNADGKLCDPFGNVNSSTVTNGTGRFVADGNNHYYSFVTDGTSSSSSIMILGLTKDNPGDLIIGDAVEISFKFRMHEGLGADQNIEDTDKMSLVHLRRGGSGHATQLSVDKNGNIYDRNGLVYTNTDGSKFLDISFKWYDATNTYTLYVNGNTVAEGLNVRDTSGDFRSYTTTTFNDDFTVSSIVQNNSTNRAIEICRASKDNKNWGFDIDDIKVSRIETAQNGAYYYSNDFDIAQNGLSKKNTAGNVYIYGGSGTSAFVAGHGTETVNGETNGYFTASKNYFGIKDIYQLLSANSFVTEFRIKGTATPSSGSTPLIQFITDGDVNDYTNRIKLFFVDANGKIYLESDESTVVNGYTLNENEWLDVAVVAVKCQTNEGLFGKITGKTKSSSNTSYTFSYFINGTYVGSTSSNDFVEWRKTSNKSYYRTASGDTYEATTYTVGGDVAALDTSALTVVDSKTTANHVIYKSVTDGIPTYYDVETVDGVQVTYSTMVITDNSNADSLRISGTSFNLKFDYLKVYEGTCPEWFYESLYSKEGGNVWNIDFAKLGRTTTSNTTAMTNTNGSEVSGTVFNSGFFAQEYNQAANGSNILLANGNYLDFYLPLPKNDAFEVEYRFEAGIKNITNAVTSSNKWEIALFNQRFENSAGENRPTGSLMYIGNGTSANSRTIYGLGRTPLYNADGTLATLDNTNGNILTADLYVNTRDGIYGITYYLDGNPLYLEDGTLAYRISNNILVSRMGEFYGKVQNYRTRIINSTGSCKVDITKLTVDINPKTSYKAADEKLEANSINAIELKLPKLPEISSAVDVLTLKKETGNALSLLKALPTGELVIGSDGKYYTLYDADNNAIKLSNTDTTKFAVVYDDINADARYFVNGTAAYIVVDGEAQKAADLAVLDTTFKTETGDITCNLLNGLYVENSLDSHKINAGDTAEIIGFQENSIVNGVRIIAGVDSLYYDRTGFEIEIYENGSLKKSENVSNNIVFSSIIGEDKTITGEEYGYAYFTTVSITELPSNMPANSYILARSYTTVAGVKHYDEQIRITVTNNGYYIDNNVPEGGDESTDDKDYYTKKQAVLLLGQSNMSGRGLPQYVEAISDDRIKAYYKDTGWVKMTEPIHKDASSGGIGLAASFAKAFVETYDCEIGLIPLAKGGSSYSWWKKGYTGASDTDLYENTVEAAKQAIADGYEICAILWHQGETNRTSTTYADHFKEIMDSLIADIGLDANKVAIITGELCDRNDPVKYPIDIINAALNSEALTGYYKNYAVASSLGLTNAELSDSHFDAPSLRVLGYRYFEGFYEAVMGKECPYEYSQNPEDYRIEPPVVEKENNSYYIADVDFDDYTPGATIPGVSLSSKSTVSTGVNKYVTLTVTTDTGPYNEVDSPITLGKDIVIEISFRVNDLAFASGQTSGNLLKIVPTTGTSIVVLRLDKDGYLYDHVNDVRFGEPLSGDEWTSVKIVCHMANNTKDIYVTGTGYTDSRTGLTLHKTIDTTTFDIAKIRIGQFSGTADMKLDMDDIKIYERPLAMSEISDNVRLIGDASALGTGISIDGSASGFAFNYNGKGNVVLNITASEETKLDVTVDGTTTKNITVPAGTSDVLIAKGLEAGDHTVKAINKTGANNAVTVNWLAFTGKLLDKPEEESCLKILAIGNSYSQDSTEYLYDLLSAAGVDNVVVGNAFISGCTIETHYQKAQSGETAYSYTKFTSDGRQNVDSTLLNMITDEKWDIITLQQASKHSGMPETYSDLQGLIDYIEANCANPDVDFKFNMTWAYHASSKNGNFEAYGDDQTTMYEAIVSTVRSEVLTKPEISGVFPVGTAIQNLRTSYIGDNLHRDESTHLTLDIGRYTAALTWTCSLTGVSPCDINWLPASYGGIIDDIHVIREAVENALETPYEVTTSTYTEKVELTLEDRFRNAGLDINDYEAIDWEPKLLYAWNASNSVTPGKSSSMPQFTASKKFTKEELPIGTVIVVDEGYKYRPDAWHKIDEPLSGTRPSATTAPFTVVDEEWWADYNYRAFNISKATGSDPATEEDIKHFNIYVPVSK